MGGCLALLFIEYSGTSLLSQSRLVFFVIIRMLMVLGHTM